MLSINQVLDLNVRLMSKFGSVRTDRGRVAEVVSSEALNEVYTTMTILPVGDVDELLPFLQSRKESGGSSLNPRMLSLPLMQCHAQYPRTEHGP